MSLDMQLHLHRVLVLVLRGMRSGAGGAVAGTGSGARTSDDRHELTTFNWTEWMWHAWWLGVVG